jgi:hypothetical protein
MLLVEELLAKIDFSAYVNKSIIIKAVRKPVPRAYVLAAQYYNYARSIMYGEACSTVPLYKTKKDELNPDMKSRYLLLFYFSCIGNAQELKETPPNFGQNLSLLFLINRLTTNNGLGRNI